jgi:hypothetical protein
MNLENPPDHTIIAASPEPQVEQDHTTMAAPPKAKRYCSDRLSKTQFIVIVSAISLAVFIALLFGIGFLVILPKV